MDDQQPAHWSTHPAWEPLFNALEELEDAATVSKAIAHDGVDEERMRRLCQALHDMPVLIARALLSASELPGYAAPPPKRGTARLYDALDRAEEMGSFLGDAEIVPNERLKIDEQFVFCNEEGLPPRRLDAYEIPLCQCADRAPSGRCETCGCVVLQQGVEYVFEKTEEDT
jgi:hypothetical protein